MRSVAFVLSSKFDLHSRFLYIFLPTLVNIMEYSQTYPAILDYYCNAGQLIHVLCFFVCLEGGGLGVGSHLWSKIVTKCRIINASWFLGGGGGLIYEVTWVLSAGQFMLHISLIIINLTLKHSCYNHVYYVNYMQ